MHKRLINQSIATLLTLLVLSLLLTVAMLPSASAATGEAGEQAVTGQINETRSNAGVSPLTVDQALSAQAMKKAQALAARGYLKDTAPIAGTSFKRSAGNSISGESWARADDASLACQLLKSISFYKKVMLDKNFSRVGIGVATGNSNTLLVLVYAGGSTPVTVPGTGTQPTPTPSPSPTPNPTPQPVPQPQPQPEQPVQGLNADEQKMLSLVNSSRASAGLKPLQADLSLVKLARLKGQDMINKNYFSHTSPTYGSPFDMMKAAGVSYRYAGENLAGASTVNSAHTNLMNSPGHRANILKGNFTKVGIGVVNGGPYGKMFVQMFIG
ncbi:MAG: hypothetical protein VR67_02530 [Peptococcaceae bacterium BRH_c8a]|nr:MAG: hypothetical protein VR67_02530 [Peptococcaceae bacterium BRH_c8a]